MKKFMKSLWFRSLVCIVCGILFVVVPNLIINNTRSNGLGAGLFVVVLLFGLPVSSLICGLLSASEPKKLWILPALPTVLYFSFFSFFIDASLFYVSAQFSGLLFGYGAFALRIYK